MWAALEVVASIFRTEKLKVKWTTDVRRKDLAQQIQAAQSAHLRKMPLPNRKSYNHHHLSMNATYRGHDDVRALQICGGFLIQSLLLKTGE